MINSYSNSESLVSSTGKDRYVEGRFKMVVESRRGKKKKKEKRKITRRAILTNFFCTVIN